MEKFSNHNVAGKEPYQPVYLQFISEIEKGFLLLDDTSRAEVVEFVKSQQNKNGGFNDRGGNADLYYSLFGAWISKALKLDNQQAKLQEYISSVQASNKIVDKFSMLLIRLVLEENGFNKPSLGELLRWVKKDAKNINAAYRFFLFMLSFDGLFGRNRLVYFVIKVFLGFYKPSNDLPCSFFAAMILARFLTGKKVENESKTLIQYFERGKGFKVFPEQENADLLSTAVSLFALKKIGADLRTIAPDCLDLVQQNYDSGAFLSGDGDSSRDLEYTFYGLLTLGVLS